MDTRVDPFVHDYAPGALHFGRGSVSDLGSALADQEAKRALVVCGRNVGANEAVIDPIRTGLGDRLASVFAETTPDKSVETALDALDRARDVDADALVPVGGGSSLDVATVTSVLAARNLDLDGVRREVREQGGISLPEDPGTLLPLLPVPTTLAGAELSPLAGIRVPMEDGEWVGSGVSGDPLTPAAVFYDPDLFETTPTSVLTGSAMNGFDKGVEALYSRNANPVTDATAVRGVRFLRTALPRLVDGDDPGTMDRAVLGTVLAQYGVAAPGAGKLSFIHAFGHGLRLTCGVQQGVAHAVMAPHAVRFLLSRVDGRRNVLAEAFDVPTTDPEGTAAGVVAAVAAVRDGLGMPTRLRDVEAVERSDFRRIAELTHDDSMMANGPPEFDPTVDDLEGVLEAAW